MPWKDTAPMTEKDQVAPLLPRGHRAVALRRVRANLRFTIYALTRIV